VRDAKGKLDLLPALAGELVGLKVDILISAGGGTTRVLKEAMTTIPIVMTNDPDPVGSGFVASLARPGGNIILSKMREGSVTWREISPEVSLSSKKYFHQN